MNLQGQRPGRALEGDLGIGLLLCLLATYSGHHYLHTVSHRQPNLDWARSKLFSLYVDHLRHLLWLAELLLSSQSWQWGSEVKMDQTVLRYRQRTVACVFLSSVVSSPRSSLTLEACWTTHRAQLHPAPGYGISSACWPFPEDRILLTHCLSPSRWPSDNFHSLSSRCADWGLQQRGDVLKVTQLVNLKGKTQV